MQQRFLTWNKVPSEVQVECLRSALDGSKEPLSVRCFFFFFAITFISSVRRLSFFFFFCTIYLPFPPSVERFSFFLVCCW